MREIAPGLWHWTALHDHIRSEVSSYYLLAERVLIDAMLPPGGLAWFEQHGVPEHVLMTNRHHDRHAWRLHEAFGCTVHCVRNGVHELAGRGPVEPFDFGDELPGGITAHEVGAICPDETALHIPAHGALACADGVVRWAGQHALACPAFYWHSAWNCAATLYHVSQYISVPASTRHGRDASSARSE